MSGFDSFLKNEKLIARLKRDIAAKRLSHAYIIEGGEGCGKRTLARLICSAVSCNNDDRPCMKCTNCDKIARAQSPDVIMVEAEKDRVQLGVDVIRRMREDAVIAPNDLPKKFYIIPKADSMNTQAQNAILKILEEPPEHVMFLLLCENADNLLSTIRSRAPIYRVEALPDDLICETLKSDERAKTLFERDPDAFNAAVKLSRGSLGRAYELTDPKSASECLELYKKAERYIELLAAKRNGASELEFYEYSTKLVKSKERDELCQIYSLLADAVRDLINVKLTLSPSSIFYTSPDKARETADRFALGKLMHLVDVFTNARDSLDRNVNINLAQVRTSSAASAAIRVK